ncbi:MAG: hypothetical protein PHN88_10070 [Ignavibacteria bacterium]|nr:hypothetical protein [Ignavibacteria bacterium]
MKKILLILLFIIICNQAYCQFNHFPSLNTSSSGGRNINSLYSNPDNKISKGVIASETSSSVYPVSIIFASVLYILSPVIMYENNKINLGLNKEISVGFGYFGEHRISFDYAYIFRKDYTQHLRAGYKYDYLLSNLRPSNNLQATSAFTFGLSYFTDFTRSGVSPDVGFGYSIRNQKLLIYPNFKFRYTYIFDKGKTNAFDLSFGLMVGIANPFSDLNIRRGHRQ